MAAIEIKSWKCVMSLKKDIAQEKIHRKARQNT